MSVLVRQRALNFKPGEKYMYSNSGFTLLAIIVKRVSGMSLREFTTKNIFEPLGMAHTHFRDDHEEIIKHDALGYEQDGKDKPFRMNLTNFDTAGATSLHTTVEDLQLLLLAPYYFLLATPGTGESLICAIFPRTTTQAKGKGWLGIMIPRSGHSR